MTAAGTVRTPAPRTMSPRNVELGLLLLAFVVTLSASALTALGRTADLPVDFVPFLATLLGLLVAAHMAVRRLAPMANPVLLPLVAILNGLGYVMIARLDPDLAANQAAWAFLGVVGFTAGLVVIRDPRRLEPYRYTLALLGVLLLLLPLLPRVGVSINGARIWLRVGGFSIQPGEFAKVTLAVFLASFLVEKRALLRASTRRVGPVHLPDAKHFGPMLLALGVAMMIMLAQRDLGSSLLFFTLFISMLYMATERVAFVAVGLSSFAIAAVVAWRRFDHVQRRVDIWIDPFADAKNAGFQIAEAAFALADGSISGTGLGLGTPAKVPFAATDMIFAAIGEELGLLGASAVLAAFVLLCATGFRIATNAASDFESLLAAGLTALLGFQAFVIIGGVIRVLPLTGVTLPFVSYGGSSLLANYAILGLLLRISDRGERPA